MPFSAPDMPANGDNYLFRQASLAESVRRKKFPDWRVVLILNVGHRRRMISLNSPQIQVEVEASSHSHYCPKIMAVASLTLASGQKMPLVGFGLWKVPAENAAGIVYNVSEWKRQRVSEVKLLKTLFPGHQGRLSSLRRRIRLSK